jgi:hypothetical protein
MHEALETYLAGLRRQVDAGSLDPGAFEVMEITVTHCEELLTQGLPKLAEYADGAFEKSQRTRVQLDTLESMAANGCLTAVLEAMREN